MNFHKTLNIANLKETKKIVVHTFLPSERVIERKEPPPPIQGDVIKLKVFQTVTRNIFVV